MVDGKACTATHNAHRFTRLHSTHLRLRVRYRRRHRDRLLR